MGVDNTNDGFNLEEKLEQDPHFMNNFWSWLARRRILEAHKKDCLECFSNGIGDPWSDEDEREYQERVSFCDLVDKLVDELAIDRDFVLSVMYWAHPRYNPKRSESEILKAQQ